MTTPLRQGRRGPFRPPINFDSDSDVSINDDNAEKLQRRQEKVLELARSSPKRLSLLPSRSNVHSMSNEMLVDHYTNCMKLSTENKITVKNAFGLHLIDYMAEMIKKKDSQFDNFQVASCTLDASAKIYSYRVDCVHADTLKIVSGLSRTDENKIKRRNEEEEAVEDAGNEPAKKKRIKKGRTIEVNLKNINTTKLDQQSEVDPVLLNISKRFLEDGSSAAVFLTSLHHYNEDYSLTLDSHKPFEFKPAPSHFGSVPVSITDLKPYFENVAKEGSRICTAFDGLQLGKWDPSDNVSNDKFYKSLHDSVFAGSENVADDYMDADDQHFSDNDVNPTEEHNSNAAAASVFDEINSSGSIMQALSMEPSEYSYFKPQFLSAWAGPNHWHVHPRPKGASVGGIKTAKITRVKKPPFEFHFTSEFEDSSFYKKSRTGLCLSKTTRQNWSEDNTTLPQNTHYDDKLFFKPFLDKSITISLQIGSNSENDLKRGDYNYSNANDVENYCPSEDFQGHHDDYNEDEDRMSPYTQPENVSQPDIFTGENLVEKPFQVPKFEIPYPRAAKKVNVKHVKSCIWEWISENKGKTNENVSSIKSFSEMYDVLPDLVTPQTAKNLSPGIAFTCLLHLANEKNLKIESNNNFSDLNIQTEDANG